MEDKTVEKENEKYEYDSGVMDFTPAQVLAGKVVTVAYAVLLCVFYALVFFGVIKIDFWSNFVGALLTCLGLIFLTVGIIQKNGVSVFLAFPFLVPGIIAILCENGVGQYAYLYPIYIAIPAISSLFVAIVCGGWKAHLKVIAIFVVAAACFVLNVVGAVQMWVSVVSCVVWALLVIAYLIYRITRSMKNE